jgi:hypothetical protein
MIPLEQTRNGCDSAHVLDMAPGDSSLALPSRAIQGGVGKPGGFTNTNDDPRVGGSVVLPGGFANTSLCDEPPETASGMAGESLETEDSGIADDDEPVYIPRVWSPGPYSRGGRPTVLTPPVKEELCKLLSIGLSRRQVASWLDIDHSVISRLAAKDEDFARSIARAEELAVVQPMMVMAAASRKNWRAAAWMLTHKGRREAPLTEEEKDQKVEERINETRCNMDYQRRVKIMEEEAREAERERKRAKEEAWDRAMLAKERAEREERRRRKAERMQKEAEGEP